MYRGEAEEGGFKEAGQDIASGATLMPGWLPCLAGLTNTAACFAALLPGGWWLGRRQEGRQQASEGAMPMPAPAAVLLAAALPGRRGDTGDYGLNSSEEPTGA